MTEWPRADQNFFNLLGRIIDAQTLELRFISVPINGGGLLADSFAPFSFLFFMPPSRPPVSGQRFQRRPSVKREPSFGAFYTTSYLTSHHPVIKRSASDTFLHEPLRRRCRLRQHRQNDTLRMVGGVPYNVVQDTSGDTLSMWQMLSLTLCMAGVQFTCKLSIFSSLCVYTSVFVNITVLLHSFV